MVPLFPIDGPQIGLELVERNRRLADRLTEEGLMTEYAMRALLRTHRVCGVASSWDHENDG